MFWFTVGTPVSYRGEAARRLEAAAEQQREHSLLAPTVGRGVERERDF